MKKAFTLIELLVVIAIIAILAAILFPVFAQAKEAAKKTTALSNAKQQGTAFNIYLSDSDDMFPLAITKQGNGGPWRVNNIYPVPKENVRGQGWDTPNGQEAANIWANSLQPYMKSFGLFELSGKRDVDVAFSGTWAGTQAKMGLQYNGILQSLSSSAINQPSVVVLAWAGFGNNNVKGWAGANPVLNCGSGDDVCQFNSGGGPQTTFVDAGGTGVGDVIYGGWDASSSTFVYGQTGPVVRTDSSAKSVRGGASVSSNNQPPATSNPENAWVAPFDALDSKGGALTLWNCGPDLDPLGAAGPSSYTCFFRPDRVK